MILCPSPCPRPRPRPRPSMRVGVVPVLVSLALAPSASWAQSATDSEQPPSVRIRLDTIFSGVPRYVLTTANGAASADDRYWRTVSMAPLQQRAMLDATHLAHDHVDAHLSAWSAIDLAAPSADGHVAGDLAVGWTRYRHKSLGAWAGRRFLAWGAPGGVHLDAVGVEVQSRRGFALDALVGRPVTPVYGALLGARPGFDGTTAAGGARLAWMNQGRAAVSTSFLEHWAQGIPVRRVVEAAAYFTPLRWLDARGSIAIDLLGIGVMQADFDLSARFARRIELEAGYGHMNPAAMIPRWSILSVFVTRTFDEARARAVFRLAPTVSVGVEGAAQHYDLPGRDAALDGFATWGSRLELFLRIASANRRAQFLAMASRRNDGVRPMTLLRVATSFPTVGAVFCAVEAASAFDNDDPAAPRTSLYARLSLDGPIAQNWRVGASLDAVRSPIAASELRGLVHLTGFYETRGRAR